MSILISGDFHNNECGEILFLEKEYLLKRYSQKQYREIQYHIILGDAGFLWQGKEGKEGVNMNILSKRPFPILCVMGNLDPVLGRHDLPEVDIGIGEKVIMVRREKPLVAYLKRGNIYHIDSKKFLALGGSLSIDKRSGFIER